MRRRWLLLTLLMVMLIGACSRAELVYENADWFAFRWAADLVDASTQQSDAWRGRFDELLQTHRELLLPDVVALLEQIRNDAGVGLTPERLDCLVVQTDALYRAHARLVIPLAVDVLSALSPAQQTHLAEELAERNRDYVEDFLDQDLEQRRTARVERYVARLERWTGRLNASQRDLVSDAIGAMPETAGAWLDYREAQQQEMLRLLQAGASKPELIAFLTAWWVEFDGRSPALRTNSLEIQRRSIALAVAIDATLEPAQRSRFIERVADLRDDLGSVMSVATAPPSIDAQRCG